MSEKLHSTPETSIEPIDTSEALKRSLEQLETAAKHEQQPDTTELRRQVEKLAVSGKESGAGEKHKASYHPHVSHKQIKHTAYVRTLAKVQEQLPTASRVFSKAVHQPTIEKVSNIGAQTIARPSGILAGGLSAFIGSGFVLYMSRKYGFQYNYTLFVALFVGGYFAGLFIELLARLIKRKQTD